MPLKSTTQQQAMINAARGDHYDTLTLGAEMTGMMESLFYAIDQELKADTPNMAHLHGLAGLGQFASGDAAARFAEQATEIARTAGIKEVA